MSDWNEYILGRPIDFELSARERAFGRALAGDFHGARGEIEAHLRDAPSDGDAYCLHAVTLIHAGELTGACSAFRRAVHCGSDERHARTQLDGALKRCGYRAEQLYGAEGGRAGARAAVPAGEATRTP
ncbi:MAG: hypothetical protein GC202_05445 [Alphaproteobacteria bacterium]|nr:hypothetical protein [Alphaproteobacteria bacterium]